MWRDDMHNRNDGPRTSTESSLHGGLGMLDKTIARGQSRLCCIGLATAAFVACALPAMALDPAPATGSRRFDESEMLESARRAASGGPSKPVNIGIPPPDELRVLEARREAELKRLSEKLKRATDAHVPKPPGPPTEPAWTTEVIAAGGPVDPGQRSSLGARPSDDASDDKSILGRATILMALNPTGSPREPVADPILCVTSGCYVSNGPQAPATYHSFGETLSIGGRLTRRAGSCNNARACIFRSVDLGVATTALLQPLDLRQNRYDRLEKHEVKIDATCKTIDGRLSCSRPVRTPTATLWIVPEHVARTIGPELLEAAVADGLHTARTAELPWSRD